MVGCLHRTKLMNLLCFSETAVKPQLWAWGADELAGHWQSWRTHKKQKRPWRVPLFVLLTCATTSHMALWAVQCGPISNAFVSRHEPDSHLCDKSWTAALQSLADKLERIKQVIRRSYAVEKESHFTQILRTCLSFRKQMEMEYADKLEAQSH